jgi:5-methylthioadenosine/S-adenosylhomocysteine deaminase
MKTMAIVQKTACSRPDIILAEDVWKIATDNAYKAFGLDLGLHEGELADLSLIDLKKPWFTPETSIISHLIYSMAGGVDTTIVNGRILMENGTIPGEQEILEKAQDQFERLTA